MAFLRDDFQIRAQGFLPTVIGKVENKNQWMTFERMPSAKTSFMELFRVEMMRASHGKGKDGAVETSLTAENVTTTYAHPVWNHIRTRAFNLEVFAVDFPENEKAAAQLRAAVDAVPNNDRRALLAKLPLLPLPAIKPFEMPDFAMKNGEHPKIFADRFITVPVYTYAALAAIQGKGFTARTVWNTLSKGVNIFAKDLTKAALVHASHELNNPSHQPKLLYVRAYTPYATSHNECAGRRSAGDHVESLTDILGRIDSRLSNAITASAAKLGHPIPTV